MGQQGRVMRWTYQGSSAKGYERIQMPLVFLDYCVERRATTNNLMSKSIFKLHGTKVPTALTGKEGDISNLCMSVQEVWLALQSGTEGEVPIPS